MSKNQTTLLKFEPRFALIFKQAVYFLEQVLNLQLLYFNYLAGLEGQKIFSCGIFEV